MSYPRLATLRAYAVHFYTALGLAAALLAIIAAAEGRARDVFIFLGIALWIDSTDGMLARGWEVVVWTPRFDGRKLDDITDYLTYTFIPIFFAWRFELVTGDWLVVLPIVLMASAYGFCHKAAKTDDGYFTGFPSYWNIAVFYMYVLRGQPVVNALILLALAVMVFIPIKYIYPSRTPELRRANLIMTALWFVAYCLITLQLERPDPTIVYLSLIYPIYYGVVSLYLHFRPRLHAWRNAVRVRGH
ncbi:MAG: CDP-alcohol phosphatidyltransferase family protein [Anaerolineae bacterium]